MTWTDTTHIMLHHNLAFSNLLEPCRLSKTLWELKLYLLLFHYPQYSLFDNKKNIVKCFIDKDIRYKMNLGAQLADIVMPYIKNFIICMCFPYEYEQKVREGY